MVIFKGSLELDDADTKKIADLTKLTESEQQKRDKTNAFILTDRTRALEQVKKLYAVVMGFAIWSCITNAFQCSRKLLAISDPIAWDTLSILAAQVFSFLSLIALFLLGAERMLDRKHLQTDSDVPTRGGFFLDLVTIGGPAIAFVVIANIFPSVALTPKEIWEAWDPTPQASAKVFRSSVADDFWWYLISLLVLYGIDLALLWVHGGDIETQKERYPELVKGYKKWKWSNFLSIVAMGLVVLFFHILNQSVLRVNLAALSVIAWHGGRFWFDYYYCFDCYYPEKKFET